MLLPIDEVANAPAIPNLKCFSTSIISNKPKYHNPTNTASPNNKNAIVARANSFGSLLAIIQSTTVNKAKRNIKLKPIIKLICFDML